MTEVELKFELPPAARGAFLHAAALKGVRPRRRRMASVYFDTPDEALARREMALRLRREDGRWVQALKAGRSGAGGLHARDEWEFERRDPSLDLTLFADTPLAAIDGAANLHERLAPAFEVDFVRTAWDVASAGARLEVVLDSGTASSGGRREAFLEVEIECLEGDPGAAFDFALRLLEEVPLRPSAVTKAERGHRLRRAAALVPVKAAPIALDPDMTPLAAARAIVRRGLDQLQANEEGVLATTHPEFVHQARVALRRMRSVLRMFRDAIGAERAQAWRDELGEVSRTLGLARDWDVFAGETLARVTAAYGDAALSRSLRARAARRRRDAREAARAALRSPRYARVMLDLARWLAQAEPQPPQQSGEALVDFASRIVRKRHKRLLAGAARLPALGEEERHGVRVDAKRLRYGVDAMASLFAPKRTARYLATLSALQDALGRANDAATAGRLLPELAPPRRFADFARGWLAATMHGDPEHEAALVKRLRDGRRIWRRKPPAGVPKA